MKPLARFPKQFDVGGKAQMAIVTCGIGKTPIKVIQITFPLVEQYFLKLIDVKILCQPVADGTHNFAILYGGAWVNQHTAEHLHVQIAIEHFDQPVI